MFSCRKMKRVLSHTRQCRMKFHGDCPVCKQLIALCCYHAKLCSEPMCQVPFCPRIKLEKACRLLLLCQNCRANSDRQRDESEINFSRLK